MSHYDLNKALCGRIVKRIDTTDGIVFYQDIIEALQAEDVYRPAGQVGALIVWCVDSGKTGHAKVIAKAAADEASILREILLKQAQAAQYLQHEASRRWNHITDPHGEED